MHSTLFACSWGWQKTNQRFPIGSHPAPCTYRSMRNTTPLYRRNQSSSLFSTPPSPVLTPPFPPTSLLLNPCVVPYLPTSFTPPPVIPNCPIIQRFSCTRATNADSGFTQPSLAHNWSTPRRAWCSSNSAYLLDQALTELNLRLTSTTISTLPTTPYISPCPSSCPRCSL